MICPAVRSPSHAETKPGQFRAQQVGAAEAGSLAQQDDAGVFGAGALVAFLGDVLGHQKVRRGHVVGRQPVGRVPLPRARWGPTGCSIG